MENLTQISIKNVCVYVPSYQGIFLALYLNKYYSDLVVLTPNDSVYTFFSNYLEITVEYLDFPSPSIKKPTTFFKVKESVENLVDSLNDQTLFFYHNAFDLSGFYLVSLWRIRGKGDVFHTCLDPERKHYKMSEQIKWYELKKLVHCTLVKSFAYITMGLKKIKILSSPFPVLGISESFLKFYGVKSYVNTSPNEIRSQVMKSKYFNFYCRTVLLGGGFNGFSEEEKNRYIRVLSHLKIRKVTLCIKPHPSENDYSIYSGFQIIPHYIPAEFVINNADLVMGIGSAAMKDSLKNNIPTVSLMKILLDQGNNRFGFLLDFLSEGYQGGKLYLPSNISELNSIINEHVGRAPVCQPDSNQVPYEIT